MKRFEGFSLFALKIISAAIILFLTVYAFKYTQDILPTAAEVPVDSTDLVWVNALFAVGAMFFYILFYIKEKKLSHKTKAVIEYVSLTTVVVAVTAASMWWITCEAHMPQSDQLYLFVGASHFADGDFGITSGSYFALYPHQLGLAFFLQWILKVVGPFNYLPLQYINVALALGVVVMGFVVLKIFRSRTSTIVLYCVFMILCIPLITYTQWVYGEIPSLFFMLALFIATLKYDENGKTVYAILMVLSATVACLVRKNTYVFLAAFLVVTVIKWLTSRQYKKIVLAVVVFLAPILAYRGLYAYYEHASGYEFVEMIPTSSWIEIGLEDKPELGPGWYRDVISEFKEYDMCTDEYAEVSRKRISERVHEMISDPGYAVAFYKRKALSQWNEPLYESLFFSTRFSDEYVVKSKLFDYFAYREGYAILLFIADRLQSLLLIGALLYSLFGITGNSNLVGHMIVVAIVGGFFFSLLWEAKARYIFPYYVLMIPVACRGFECMAERVKIKFMHKAKEDYHED